MSDNVLLCAINSKYIHTSLSVRALYHYVNDSRVLFREFTINENSYGVMSDIYALKCKAVLFSCYIWNIEFVLEVASMLKSVSPHTQIILGGPEVSYTSESIMQEYKFIDGIIRGEGEETFKEYLAKGIDIDGITHRKNSTVIKNPDRNLISDLGTLPFPYAEDDLLQNREKLLYYESSRGCPFNCSYCISSTLHSVRFKPIEIVKEDLLKFINSGAKIVKFVDRTFNADKKRTAKLLQFLIDNAKNTTFHFEVAADILNDEIIKILQASPKGLFQLEIGVQSTNPTTIAAIDRKTNFEKISQNVKKLLLNKNIHIHLDLIAGLPYEDINTFKKSFDDVFALGADAVQLGFLKLLHGTKIRSQENEFNYKFTHKPPYEVLANDFLSFDDISLLKGLDMVIDKFYNSTGFEHSMKYLLQRESSPFEFFTKLYMFVKEKGYERIGISKQTLYSILADFQPDDKLFRDILKLDFLLNNKPQDMPWFLQPYDRALLKRRFEILNEEFIQENLSEYENTDAREIVKTVHFDRFYYDVLGNLSKKDNIIIFDRKYNKTIVIRS